MEFLRWVYVSFTLLGIEVRALVSSSCSLKKRTSEEDFFIAASFVRLVIFDLFIGTSAEAPGSGFSAGDVM